MNILQLGMGWFPEQAGGLNRFYYDLVWQLNRENIDVNGLVVGSDNVKLDSHGQVTGFSSKDKSLIARWSDVRRSAASTLSQTDIDLVASHFALYTFPVLDKLRDKPMVVHFQGPWSDEGAVEGGGRISTAMKSFIERSVYKRAQRCIVLSSAFGDILAGKYGVDEELIRVVPGGVDAARYSSDESMLVARARIGWPTDRPVVFVVRRLARRMGLENLIEAVVDLRQHIPDILVLVAGKGPIQHDLERRILERDLSHHFRLLGFVEDEILPVAYRAADLTIVPTIALEGFGLITLESLASGTPVLVTPIGGLPETVAGLSSDLILPGAQTEDLAQGIRSALDGSIKLPDEQSCVDYVKHNFDWSIIAKRIMHVYEEALN